MRIVTTFIILLAFAWSSPKLALAQDLSRADPEKLKQAEMVAERFVERFRQTLDFEAVWKEFQMSDPSCTYRANGFFSKADYRRLNFSDALIEKLYLSFMNFYYLKNAYALSVARMYPGSNLSEEDVTPKEDLFAERKSKHLGKDEGYEKPQTTGEVEGLIAEFNRLAMIYRKHMPRNAMRSAAWRANINYFVNRGGIVHLDVSNGDTTFCVPDSVKVYPVDRGLFYIYLVEEMGQMRVAGLGLIDSV